MRVFENVVTWSILIEKFAFLLADVDVDHPDKKSIMMYVMCFFQVLPHSDIVIDDQTTVTTKHKSSKLISQVGNAAFCWVKNLACD